MRRPSAHAQVLQLIHILQIEDQARMCTTREEARALIREGDLAKLALWGSTELNYGR
jgi:hypothetical protein